MFVAAARRLRAPGPLVAFFAAIGLGFMLVEMSLMQRLIIVLGHPTYGLSVVLFALLDLERRRQLPDASITAAPPLARRSDG